MFEPAFSYDVKISHGSALLSHDLFGNCFPRVAEMVITSKQFEGYEECASAMTNLLAVMAALNTRITERNHVIVTKTNPMLANPPGKVNADEQWESSTLMRAFVADADALKASTLQYDIVGQIKLAEDSSELIGSVLPKLPQ